MFKIIAILSMLELSTQQVYPWEVFHPLHKFDTMEACTEFVDTNKYALGKGLEMYLQTNPDYFGYVVAIQDITCKDTTGLPQYQKQSPGTELKV